MATNAGSQPSDNGIFGRLFGHFTEEFYLLFRLIFAFVVALHGAQKAFGLWGFPGSFSPPPMVYVAGWVEFIGALLIGFGFLTRLGAGAMVVTMVVAYFMAHSPRQPWPHLDGGGEVPLLLFAIAGIIGIMGSRKWGIERLLFGKEIL